MFSMWLYVVGWCYGVDIWFFVCCWGIESWFLIKGKFFLFYYYSVL